MDPNVKYAADHFQPFDDELAKGWAANTGDGPLMAFGPCPRCGHDIELTIVDQVTAAAAGGEGVPDDQRATRQLRCNCKEGHKSSPAGRGCGAWWLLTLTREPDGSWSVHPSRDAVAGAAATELDKAVQDEVTVVRASAEKWIPGVAALYGLFGLAAVISGKDALAGLSLGAKIASGAMFGCGLIAAGASVVLSYWAAYPVPKTSDVSRDDRLKAWYAQRREIGVQSAERLRAAIGWAVASLVFLLVGVGLIWFGPRDTASPVMKVDYLEAGLTALPASACGNVLGLDHGTVRVEVSDPPESRVLTINAVWVTAMTPQDSCS